MATKRCICHFCGRQMEFGEEEMPCQAMNGWLVLSTLKEKQNIERHGFCSMGCLKKWVDSQSTDVPEIFIKSMDEEDNR